MNDQILHEPGEQEEIFPRGKLISLLDILGGGRMTCDACGRWQSFSALTSSDARNALTDEGWKFDDDGSDYCPRCAAESGMSTRGALDS